MRCSSGSLAITFPRGAPISDAPRELLSRRGRMVLRRRQLEHVEPVGRGHGRTAALAAHPVATEVQRNAIEPRRELRLALEALDAPKCAKKSLLTDISSLLLATQGAIGECIDGPFPSEDELIEALQIAADGAGDQLLVGARHERSRVPFSTVSGPTRRPTLGTRVLRRPTSVESRAETRRCSPIIVGVKLFSGLVLVPLPDQRCAKIPKIGCARSGAVGAHVSS